jgi:hypothetical protein
MRKTSRPKSSRPSASRASLCRAIGAFAVARVAWIDAREMRFGKLILKPSLPVLPVLQANGCETRYRGARRPPDLFSIT